MVEVAMTDDARRAALEAWQAFLDTVQAHSHEADYTYVTDWQAYRTMREAMAALAATPEGRLEDMKARAEALAAAVDWWREGMRAGTHTIPLAMVGATEAMFAALDAYRAGEGAKGDTTHGT